MRTISLVVVGLHERDTSLDLLEQLAVNDRDLPKALQELCDSPHLSEAVILSTCMRTEVYAVLERFHDGLADIRTFFEYRLGATSTDQRLDEGLFVKYEEAAARHLFHVAAGVDSPVLGEGEILRQVRHAAERARVERASGPVLGGLFRHAIEVGKRSRSETGISRGITSLSHVVVELAAKHHSGSLADIQVAVVGAGEMGEGILAALTKREDRPEIVLLNRTFAKSTALSGRHGTRTTPFERLAEEIATADVVISATASDAVLVEHDTFRSIMTGRADWPILIIDAAMPRDVDPAVGEIPGVTLLDVADLSAYAENEMASRAAEITRVEAIVRDELERYRMQARARSVAPVVTALRSKAEQVRREELERFRGRLGSLEPSEKEAVEALTRGLVAKFLHEPTVQLKDAGGSPRGERLAEALRALFGL